MKRHSLLGGALVLVLALTVAGVGYCTLDAPTLWSHTPGDVVSGLGEETLVMRTPGGLLEVSTIHANEHFDEPFTYSLLGIEIGRTVPHIQVPAVYRYHIELAPEWPVRRLDRAFTVVAPAVKPSLPVAVDLARMQKDVGGSWVLVALNADDDLDALERQITAKLATKASSAVYLQMQREQARQTVVEFVRKWLMTQGRWQNAADLAIRVRFADEFE
jgi:hypothetical protein